MCNDALEAESDLASSKMIVQRGKEEIEDLMKTISNLKKKNLELDGRCSCDVNFLKSYVCPRDKIKLRSLGN